MVQFYQCYLHSEGNLSNIEGLGVIVEVRASQLASSLRQCSVEIAKYRQIVLSKKSEKVLDNVLSL